MKTVFILLPLGLTIRNFIHTGVLDKLAARSDVRVVALTQRPEEVAPKPHSKLLFKQFPKQSRYTFSRLVHRILRVRFDKINENKALHSFSKTARVLDPKSFVFDTLMSQPFPKSGRIYNWIRSFATHFGRIPADVRALFEEYKPSLILSTNPTRMTDYTFLKYAKQTGVTTVGMIKSWDVLLTKGYMPETLDYYLVWTPVMKEDLMRFYDIPDELVGVTGIPQFDIYAEPVSISRREDFLREFGLDSQKKTILFSTSSPWVGPQEPAILNRLAQSLCTEGGKNVQILARLHPMDDPRRYQSIRYPNLFYQNPGFTSEDQNERYLDPLYLPRLRDTLAYSDVVINTASTMTLDAAALNKPVVNLALDLEPTDYWQSSRRFYEFEHYMPIVQSGAAKIARTFDELLAFVHRYLENPHLESEERAGLREKMCHRVDGQSVQRVADHLFCALDGKSFSA